MLYKKNAKFSETQLLRLFRGICYAIQAIHQHRLPRVPTLLEGEISHHPSITVSDADAFELETRPFNDDDTVAYCHRDIKPGYFT